MDAPNDDWQTGRLVFADGTVMDDLRFLVNLEVLIVLAVPRTLIGQMGERGVLHLDAKQYNVFVEGVDRLAIVNP